MERFLRLALRHYIRAGNLRLTTAGGKTYSFGDGTGAPVAIRFLTGTAERGVLFDPEIRFGEAYMDGSLVIEEGSIADVLAIILDSVATASRRRGRVCNGTCATSIAAGCSSIRDIGRGATWPITTISTGSSTPSSSTQTGNTAAAISRHPSRHWTMPSSQRDVTSRQSSCSSPGSAYSTSAVAGVGWRCTWRSFATSMSPASRCRRSSTPLRRRAPPSSH